jgi:DedD protein
MFKPRSAAATATPPSVELVRQRAKHRLMGVSVLVLAAVVLFPLLFDTQPRPLPVDIPIEIPSRKTAKPLTVEPAPEAPAEPLTSAAPKSADAKVAAKADGVARALADDEEVIISHSPARAPAAQVAPAVKPPAVKPEAVKPESPPVREAAVTSQKDAAKDSHKEPAKPVPPKEVHKEPAKEPAKEQPKPVVPKEVAKEPAKEPAKDVAAEAARAQALLEGKALPAAAKPSAPAASDPSGARYIVQVGAFADGAVAQSARLKLERAGLKTYTHEAQTPEGKRIRVRLGPFATRAEAEKAAAKAKATGTAAAILTL